MENAVYMSATGALMQGVVKIVRVMGVEVVWLGVLRSGAAGELGCAVLGRARSSDSACQSSEADAA